MFGFLNKNRKGVGGVFLIVTSAICAFTMITIISLSRTNYVMSVADNIAQIISTKVAIHCYNTNEETFANPKSGSGPQGLAVKKINGTNYYPLKDFIEIAKDFEIIGGRNSKSPNKCSIMWYNEGGKSYAAVKIGEFKCNWGETMKPREQRSIIEGD